jgi:hypothetical protein
MSKMLNQIHAAEKLNEIYREWKINPAYPEDVAGEFDRVMNHLSNFVDGE